MSLACSAPAWLQDALRSTQITDLCLNGHNEAFADLGQGLESLCVDVRDPGWTESEFKTWLIEELSRVGKTCDARNPFIDATLPSGHRIHATFPPLSQRGILVSLRRLPMRSLQPLGRLRWAQSPLYSPLAEAVIRGDSVIVSGSTGSGKTTLITDLVGEIPSHERIIALEDTPELHPVHPHFLSLISRPANADGCGEVSLRTLLKQTLRMRPDRVILGECRGPEVLELLQALNTGHKGAMATLHANSPRDALRRIELLCLLSGGGTLPTPAIRELLALGIQWIAQVSRSHGKRIITELWKVEGREGDSILMRPVVV